MLHQFSSDCHVDAFWKKKKMVETKSSLLFVGIILFDLYANAALLLNFLNGCNGDSKVSFTIVD